MPLKGEVRLTGSMGPGRMARALSRLSKFPEPQDVQSIARMDRCGNRGILRPVAVAVLSTERHKIPLPPVYHTSRYFVYTVW